MRIDAAHPLNQLVLQYLRGDGETAVPLVASPDSVADARAGQGSHPDIVQRVWDQLGGALPRDCRCLVFGTPALVHPVGGIVLAICNGTQYNLRLTAASLTEAAALGAKTVNRWSTGDEMDAGRVLGGDWVFGGWTSEELRWCRDTYDAVEGRPR